MARLPNVLSDTNNWGTILNSFLSIAHNSDGSLKLVSNVADYGASPTAAATVNDTAFANAIAAIPAPGGVLYVPPIGTYFITQPIIINNDGIAMVSFGQRDGAATIQIDPSADPTYALIVGNTRNADSCLVSGIAFIGRNTTTSTGKGILFRSNGGKILQTKVALFGGNGIDVGSFSGTIFEVFFDDVELAQNGMNATTPGNNLSITGNVSDCEYHRVISQGDAAKSTTLNGIYVSGSGQQKFVDCHAYFCKNDGFNIVTGVGCQIIGGEWETNTLNGIESGGTNLVVIGASCFANLNTDISTYAQATIMGCTLSSSGAFYNIYANSASGGIISDNTCSAATLSAMYFDTGASGYNVHDNVCSAATASVIQTKSTNSDFHDNTILAAGNIVELTGANTNYIHDNTLIGGGTITLIGAATKLRDNVGYNPVGSLTAPSVPATTVAIQNTFGTDVNIFILGGTITVIAVGNASGTTVATGLLSSAAGVTVPLKAGQWIKLTYSVAPTWKWFGL